MNDAKLKDYRRTVVEFYFELLQEAIDEICKLIAKEHVKDAVARFFEVYVTKCKMGILPAEAVKRFFSPVPLDLTFTPMMTEQLSVVDGQVTVPSYAYTKEAEVEMFDLARGISFSYDDYQTLRIVVRQVFDRWKFLYMQVYQDTPDSDGAPGPA